MEKFEQVKSGIGRPKDQKDTLLALGFHRMHQVVELNTENPCIAGMVNKVKHLLEKVN